MNNNQPNKRLNIDDTWYETQYSSKFENRKKWSAPDPGLIMAFLPGTVYEVSVKEGDQVAAGDVVLRFEAMKMINDIQAHSSGTVTKIHVSPGDRFSKGAVLLEIR